MDAGEEAIAYSYKSTCNSRNLWADPQLPESAAMKEGPCYNAAASHQIVGAQFCCAHPRVQQRRTQLGTELKVIASLQAPVAASYEIQGLMLSCCQIEFSRSEIIGCNAAVPPQSTCSCGPWSRPAITLGSGAATERKHSRRRSVAKHLQLQAIKC